MVTTNGSQHLRAISILGKFNWMLRTYTSQNKSDEDKVIRLSSPIIIKQISCPTGVEKITITDGKNIERIETSDILTTQKLPKLVMFGFSINEKYIKSLGNALQIMRQSLDYTSNLYLVGICFKETQTLGK